MYRSIRFPTPPLPPPLPAGFAVPITTLRCWTSLRDVLTLALTGIILDCSPSEPPPVTPKFKSYVSERDLLFADVCDPAKGGECVT